MKQFNQIDIKLDKILVKARLPVDKTPTKLENTRLLRLDQSIQEFGISRHLQSLLVEDPWGSISSDGKVAQLVRAHHS